MRSGTDGSADGKPARIMIVDDHEISRAACRALLRTEGLDITADLGTSGDVLAAASTLHPDVALVDVTPATDAGFVLARGLRELPSPPTVILTSSADRAVFGGRTDGYWFVAKADISAAAITILASRPGPQPGTGELTGDFPDASRTRGGEIGERTDPRPLARPERTAPCLPLTISPSDTGQLSP